MLFWRKELVLETLVIDHSLVIEYRLQLLKFLIKPKIHYRVILLKYHLISRKKVLS